MKRFNRAFGSVRAKFQALCKGFVPLVLLAGMLAPKVAEAAPNLFPSATVNINTPVGTTSVPQLFELVGTLTPLIGFTVNNVTLTGAGAAQFAITSNTCNGQAITLALDCEILVTYTANDTTPDLAGLQFQTSNGTFNFATALSGNGTVGPNLLVSPSFIAFGDGQIGAQGPVRIAQIANTGTTNLTIDSIAISGVNAADFAILSDTCTDPLGFNSVLPAGATCLIELTFQPTVSGFGSFSASVDVSAEGGLQTGAVQLDGGVANGIADLSITKSADLAQVVVPSGGSSAPVTYTITVTNNGPDQASAIQVRDFISGPFTVTSITPDQGSCYVAPDFVTTPPTLPVSAPVEIYCRDISLDSTDTMNIVVVGTVDAPGQVDDIATVQNFANDGLSTMDPDDTNNVAVASTVGISATSLPQADLRIIKEVNNLSPLVGSVITYQLHVRNMDATQAADGLTLRDITVGNITNLNVSASPGWTCTTTGAGTNPPLPPGNNPRRIECTNLSPLPPLTTRTITLTGTVTGTEPITNTATISSSLTNDPDLSDN
ncbi:MAG: DUF11 domain-containing protein, partial [Deltaproteobacteria bacterium]|nr:DUF11 domain-containing protein [Deltaproteobacteria bacterium]